MRPNQIRDFVTESNRIEGIHRPPTPDEVDALTAFLGVRVVLPEDITTLAAVFQPGAILRDCVGLDVRVGTHRPPPGGPEILGLLNGVLGQAIWGVHPYTVHHAYEKLHPLTDGNGRSGRALWLWGMRRLGARAWNQALTLGFLHCWYYESLEFSHPK